MRRILLSYKNDATFQNLPLTGCEGQRIQARCFATSVPVSMIRRTDA
jgi:hypothetical protein